MIKNKVYYNIIQNKYVKELETLVLNKRNTKFVSEIEDILQNKGNGIGVINNINEVLKNKYNENKDFILRRIRTLLENRNFKRITISIVVTTIFLYYGSLAYAITKNSIPITLSNINAFNNTNPFIRTFIMEANQDITAFAPADLQPVTRFINLVISMIRTLTVSVCGLIAAKSGLVLLTEDTSDGPREAKKSFQKILWALFMVFAATAIASVLARRLLG